MPFFVSDVPRVALAPPAGFEPATYCLEGIRSFSNRNRASRIWLATAYDSRHMLNKAIG